MTTYIIQIDSGAEEAEAIAMSGGDVLADWLTQNHGPFEIQLYKLDPGCSIASDGPIINEWGSA